MPETMSNNRAVPDLAELFARYVGQSYHATPPVVQSEVETYQGPASAWFEPSEVWPNALTAAKWLLHGGDAIDFQPGRARMLPAWGAVVRDYAPTATVLFCIGNVPQLLREMTPLLGKDGVNAPKPRPSAGALPHALVSALPRTFGPQQTAAAVMTAATLRLAHQFDAAEQVLGAAARVAPVALGGLLANEQAALAWTRGDAASAHRLWEASPAAENPVFRFNRGVAALASGDSRLAVPLLRQAAEAQSELSAWHHLARLYLTLAEAA